MKILRSGLKLVVISALILYFLFAQTASASPITNDNIIQLTNEARIENGLNPLSVSPKLNTAAQNKATDIAERNYWSHQTPEGKPFWYFAEQADYNWSVLGENLAADFITAEGTFNAWLSSYSHKKNILNHKYEEIGVGVNGDIVAVLYGKENQSVILDYLNKIPTLLSQFLIFNL